MLSGISYDEDKIQHGTTVPFDDSVSHNHLFQLVLRCPDDFTAEINNVVDTQTFIADFVCGAASALLSTRSANDVHGLELHASP
jgi:hypothetical protein